ncbi:MAG: hypothetical protein PHI44_00250 [Candidatus Ratteibacteria bacterium]|nr:hypothetical protein [Candidatus Ratteibacteria bacterium]
MEIHWEDSYLSEVFTGASLSKNSLHPVLEDVGQDRQGIAEFLRSFVCGYLWMIVLGQRKKEIILVG